MKTYNGSLLEMTLTSLGTLKYCKVKMKTQYMRFMSWIGAIPGSPIVLSLGWGFKGHWFKPRQEPPGNP